MLTETIALSLIVLTHTYFLKQPSDVYARLGDKVRFPCRLKDKKSIQWCMNGNCNILDKLGKPRVNRYFINSTKRGVYDLIISNVTASDEGSYSCKIACSRSKCSPTLISRKGRLFIVRLKIIGSGILYEGIKTNLSCIGKPHGKKLSWYLDNDILESGYSPRINFQQLPDRNWHMRELRCSMHHIFVTKTLFVNYGPVVEIKLLKSQNGILFFHCDVEGRPEAKKRWLLGKNAIYSDILEIEISTAFDVLACEANNSLAKSKIGTFILTPYKLYSAKKTMPSTKRATGSKSPRLISKSPNPNLILHKLAFSLCISFLFALLVLCSFLFKFRYSMRRKRCKKEKEDLIYHKPSGWICSKAENKIVKSGKDKKIPAAYNINHSRFQTDV